MVDPNTSWPDYVAEHYFVISQISGGVANSCTVVEEPVAGYEATYVCGQDVSSSPVDDELCNDRIDFSPGTTACGWLDVQPGDVNLCEIFNDPSPVEVEVIKVWEMFGAETQDINTNVKVTLFCDAEIVDGTQMNKDVWFKDQKIKDYTDDEGKYVGEGSAIFEVIPDWYPTETNPNKDQTYTECWVEENVKSDLVEVDNGCGDTRQSTAIQVAVGMGDECTITNTVFFEGIPTLSQWGMAIMALLMLGVGFVSMRRFV